MKTQFHPVLVWTCPCHFTLNLSLVPIKLYLQSRWLDVVWQLDFLNYCIKKLYILITEFWGHLLNLVPRGNVLLRLPWFWLCFNPSCFLFFFWPFDDSLCEQAPSWTWLNIIRTGNMQDVLVFVANFSNSTFFLWFFFSEISSLAECS